MVLEKTLENPLDCKEIQPVHPKGNQSWIFIGRTDAETESPLLWPPDVKNWLIGKDPKSGNNWRQEEEGNDRGWGLPLWLSWQNIHLQCGRPGFNPWVGKIPWRGKRLPTPVFWPGEFRGITESRTRLSHSHFFQGLDGLDVQSEFCVIHVFNA